MVRQDMDEAESRRIGEFPARVLSPEFIAVSDNAIYAVNLASRDNLRLHSPEISIYKA
jgi:hypothetical protein